MSEVTTIGLDIAKTVFHAHGADASGRMVFSRRLTRAKLLDFFTQQPPCTIALEACGGAHHWARELALLGHEVRLIPPAYVKPFVKRMKNDAVDAQAICEAAQRPGMRFVPIKTEEQQAAGIVFRTRDLLVRQRTQLVNALRGHLTEYGWTAPRGRAHPTTPIPEFTSCFFGGVHRCHWLSLDGISRLQNILTGGVVAALAGGHLKRRIG